MAPSLDTLAAEHRQLERTLAVLDQEADGFRDAEALDFPLWADLIAATALSRDRGHRFRELQIFDRLVDRSGRPLLVLEVLKRRMAAAAAAQRRLSLVLDRAAAGAVAPRAELEAAARAYTATLRDEIALEERAIFPVIRGVFDRRDWTGLEPPAKARNH